MFPLTNKEPYIKSSGERTTLGDMFAQAGGDISELEQEVDNLKEALTDITNYVKDTGVKNFYVGSPSFDGYSSISSWEKQTETYNGHDVYKRSGSGAGPYKLVYLPIGTYTFSCAVKTNDGETATIYTTYAGASTATVDISSKNVQTTTGWATYSATFKVTTAGTVALRIAKAAAGDIYISEYQIEAGSTATPYQPYAMTNKELTDAKIDASEIAPIENGATASTSYSQGAYFIHNGKFCKAKTSISSGATFTKGTNYEETTVAAELIALV